MDRNVKNGWGSRSVAVAALVSAGVLASALPVSAKNLTATTANPPAHFAVKHGMEPLIACLEEKSGGEYDITLYPSGQIASNPASLDALTSGLADISYVATTSVSEKLPLANITILPSMGGTVTQMVAAWREVMNEGGPFADELASNNIHPLVFHMYPPYQVGIKGDPITSLEEFAGKKIRILGGSQVFAVSALGAVPIQMSGGDSYVGLQQGTIDGYMLAPTSIESYSLQEQSQSISTNAAFSGAQAIISVREDVYQGLPDNEKAWMDECSAKVEADLASWQDTHVAELEKVWAEAGVNMYQFSEEALAAIDEKLELSVSEYVKRLTELGLPAQEALDQFRAALAKTK